MKIIALVGKSSIGKSQVVVSVSKKLQKKFSGKANEYESFQLPEYDEKKRKKEEVICYVYDKKHKINIGIVSYGDPNGYLQEGVEKIRKNHKIDLLICASRTKGETLNYLEKLSKNVLLIKKMYVQNGDEKEIENEYKTMNNIIAEWIVENYYNIYQKF